MDDKPKKPADVFGDLLGSQGYEFAAKRESGPRTMNAMRKEEMVREMDPDKLKIHEWVRTNTNLNYLLMRWCVFSIYQFCSTHNFVPLKNVESSKFLIFTVVSLLSSFPYINFTEVVDFSLP